MKAPDDLPHDSARECDDLRPDLFLYAEGELECPSSLLRIRRHLRGCPACQDHLDTHDALTRAVLTEGYADVPALLADGSRADRIMELILAESSPDDSPTAFPGPTRTLRLEAPPLPPAAAPGLSRGVAAAAAALLLVGFLASLAFLTTSDDDRLVRSGDETARARRTAAARQGPRSTLASNERASARPVTEPSRTLWLALPRDRVLEALPPDFPVRLLGFSAEPGDPSSGGSLALEWVVEAVVDERPSSGKRVFLVPEGSQLMAIEIAPRAWIERWRALHQPPEASRFVGELPAEGERAYHAYVLEEPGSLGDALPAPVLGSSRPFLPGEVPAVAPPEWVLPARWKN